MSDPRHDFETHRCGAMPSGFSLRRYRPDGERYRYPDAGGWVLGSLELDSEWGYWDLEHVTPNAHEHVRFCPWCGEVLKEVGA